MYEIRRCEVCGGEELTPVLNLGQHALCDDLVPIGNTRTCREYPIEILFCETCLTGHQRYQVPKQELFPPSYHYRSRFTADVLSGMRGLVESCHQRFGSLAGRTVVDVGCNDGSLLDFFRDKSAVTVGIEPTDAADDAKQKGHRVFKAFLTKDVAAGIRREYATVDVITFTNVFAHIEPFDEMLAALKLMISANTILVIENHYLGAILDGNQFDTFYHKRLRTYSFRSFTFIARSLGAEVLACEFPSRHGGNIRVFLGSGGRNQAGTGNEAVAEWELEFLPRFEAMNRNMLVWKRKKTAELARLVRRHGPLRAMAIPWRAVILVKLLGLNTGMIAAVHEKPGSMKIGHYVPGTRIPIESDDELFAIANPSAPLVNLAWHIPGEIRGYLAEHGYAGPVIDVIGPEDFPAAA